MSSLIGRPIESLQQQSENLIDLFQAQHLETRRELETQARQLAASLLHNSSQAEFTLPCQVIYKDFQSKTAEELFIPAALRTQTVQNKNSPHLSKSLDRHLVKLEGSPLQSVSTGAALLRYAAAEQIVNDVWPEDRFVTAQPADPIPEAQAELDWLRRCETLLEAAATLAPWMVLDEGYLQKHNALLQRLIDAGRSLAGCITEEIIATIKRREEAGDLNRGLSLSLPYFDDRALELKTYDFEVIPSGRILFEPAYVMWVARHEQQDVEQNLDLSAVVRGQLLAELRALEKAFEVPGAPIYRRRRTSRKNLVKTRLTPLRVALEAISVGWNRKTGI